MSSDSPCRILACVSRNQLADCLTWLSNKFNDVIIRFNVCKFDERSNTPQMLIYIEDDLIEDENILSFISCRNYNYLFFCKTSNKHWKDTLLSEQNILEETDEFVLLHFKD